MKLLEKIFGEIKMTWPKLIAFSIAIGVLVGLIMINPAWENNAIREIGISYEMWFILAIFVISNCKSTLDAGVKCFVFFLISQPLIYLVQQPFASINLIKSYYLYWFIITLFTFPGAMIAYQIKRKDMLGALILSVAGLSMGVLGTGALVSGFTGRGISYVIYGLIILAAVVIFALIFCPTKKTKAIYAVIVGIFIFFYAFFIGSQQFNSGSYTYLIEEEGTWTLDWYGCTDSNVTIDENQIIFDYNTSNANAEVIYVNDKGEKKTFIFRVEGKNVVVEEK